MFLLEKTIIRSSSRISSWRTGCGAVGSALRSGRRGRRFKSDHPDHVLIKKEINMTVSVLSKGVLKEGQVDRFVELCKELNKVA